MRKAAFTEKDLQRVLSIRDPKLRDVATQAAKRLQRKTHEANDYARILSEIQRDERRMRANFESLLAGYNNAEAG